MKWGLLRRAATMVVVAALLVAMGSWASAAELPILMYHHLTEDETQTSSMTITVERFRLDMEFLQQFGYTALLPSDLIEIRNGTRPMPEKPVMITFDDGYRSNYDYAYPILQQTGMRAAVAVIAHNIRAEQDTDETRGSMTWGELREMRESGVFEIGSHSCDLHNPQYGGMSAPDGIDGVERRPGESYSAYDARAGADVRTSLALIRQHTGQETVNYFSYPFGAYDSWMEQILTSENVAVTTLTNPGVADLGKGLRRLPRYRITMEQPLSGLLRQSRRAVPALANVQVNGVSANLPAYRIDGNNYVRVRDVAMLLQGTASGFDVQWDESTRRVALASFAPYVPNNKENLPIGGATCTMRSLTEPTVVDGVPQMIAAYYMDGFTYYKLRSLGELCGFGVEWEQTSETVIITP